MDTKRKRGLLTSSTLPEVSPNTYNNHIRVKAHAIGVSILAFTLGCYFNFGEISGNKIQADASYLYVNQLLLFYHKRCSFIGSTIFVGGKDNKKI